MTAEIAPSAHPTATVSVIKKRRDFLAASRARRHTTAGVLVQGRARRDGEPGVDGEAVRVGYTCSKKIGNAVTRNRAKRRLRAAVAEVLPAAAQPGWDYVMVGRPGATVARPFAALKADIAEGLTRVHAPRKPQSRPQSKAPSKPKPEARRP
ncbi:MAG: ribonuclease P protein component [Pseudomonadota bacterium]